MCVCTYVRANKDMVELKVAIRIVSDLKVEHCASSRWLVNYSQPYRHGSRYYS